MKYILITLLIFLIGCAPQFSSEKVSLLHQDHSFEGRVEEGRTLLVFPVVMDTLFLSMPRYEEIVEPLNIRGDRLVLTKYKDFRNSISGTEERRQLEYTEDLLLHELSLDLPDEISWYDAHDFRFLQLFRVRNAYTVMNEAGEFRKHLTLEGEVWDVRLKGVVWRAQTVVESSNKNTDDLTILLRGIELLYETLPKFYFNSAERNW